MRGGGVCTTVLPPGTNTVRLYLRGRVIIYTTRINSIMINSITDILAETPPVEL